MSSGGGLDGPEDAGRRRLGIGQRILLALPRLGRHPDKKPLGERLRRAVLKPQEPGQPPRTAKAPGPRTVAELEELVARADDKERLIGLLAAPLAAIIAITVSSALIDDDPSVRLKNGKLNPLHVSVSLYHNLTLVILGLSVLILLMAWLRKRMFLGMALALYGLAIFNLHYWGFGIPFVLAGAWYLVRAYRLQQDLKVATGQRPPRPGDRRPGGRTGVADGRPPPNRRYTPPRRPSPKKPENEKRAG